MDPNETLARLRRGYGALTAYEQDASWYKDNASAIDLIVESVVDLDEWLTSGGFLPTEWHTSGERLLDPL